MPIRRIVIMSMKQSGRIFCSTLLMIFLAANVSTAQTVLPRPASFDKAQEWPTFTDHVHFLF
jgi:hypothetical protein